MEGRGRRNGIAPTGRTPESAHRLALLLVQPGGELAERAHAAIAGQPRRDRDRQIAGDAVAPAARLAEIGNLLQKVAQTAQLRHRHRRLLRPDAPLGRLLDAAQRRARVRLQLVHVDLLRLSVLAPPNRAARQAREAPRAPQHPPVRRPVAGAREARRIHERLRQQNRETVRRAHVPRQPPQTQTQHPRRQVARGALAAQNHDSGYCWRSASSRRNCRSRVQPIQASRAATLNAPAVQPTSATQVSPRTATWRRHWPNRPLNGR